MRRPRKDSFVSIEKAERILGFCPPLYEPGGPDPEFPMVLRLMWIPSGTSPGTTHRVPWNQGILKIAKRFF